MTVVVVLAALAAAFAAGWTTRGRQAAAAEEQAHYDRPTFGDFERLATEGETYKHALGRALNLARRTRNRATP